MRKLIFILIAFIAAVTFIRAFDNKGDAASVMAHDLSEDVINFNPDH
jgi:hypothetical protein